MWFATRGMPLIGVPNFAYEGRLEEVDGVLDIFSALVNYVYSSGAVIQAGHTMQIADDIYLRTRHLDEYIDYLGEDIIVLERITASQVNV